MKVLSNMMVRSHRIMWTATPGNWALQNRYIILSWRRSWKNIREDPEELAEAIRKNIHELIPKHITKEDILASINYNIHLEYGYWQ